MKRLAVHPGPEAMVLPGSPGDPPDYWFFQFDDSRDSRVPLLVDVYPIFRQSKVFDFDERTVRPLPDAVNGYYAKRFRVGTPLAGNMLFFKAAKKPESWIVVFPDEKPHGKIFIYDTENTP